MPSRIGAELGVAHQVRSSSACRLEESAQTSRPSTLLLSRKTRRRNRSQQLPLARSEIGSSRDQLPLLFCYSQERGIVLRNITDALSLIVVRCRTRDKDPGGLEVMEATLTAEVAVEPIAVEAQNEDLNQLSNIELVLVGGGMGAVVFF